MSIELTANIVCLDPVRTAYLEQVPAVVTGQRCALPPMAFQLGFT